ncbi:outer membrane protein [Bartonella sp. DGB2]|uniref:outer membrane protein n=1 Tax=Bartonella sp. DGB2 TaxID=3388426 RepID=UPI0039901893
MRFIMLGRGAKKYGWAYLHYEDHPCFWGEGTGLYVGYNFPLGQSLIFGMEAGGRTKRLVGRAVKREDAQNALQNLSSDIAIDDIDPLLVESLTGVGRVLESQLFLHESWEAGVQARLGYGMRRFLPYVAAGMAYARIEVGGLFHVLSDTGASIELGNAAHTHVNQWKIGYDVAVGADYALSNHIIARGEYRYNDFGDLYLTMPYSTYQISYRRHDFALGLFYLF